MSFILVFFNLKSSCKKKLIS